MHAAFRLKSTLSAFKLKSKFGILPKLMFATACGASTLHLYIAVRHMPKNRTPTAKPATIIEQ